MRRVLDFLVKYKLYHLAFWFVYHCFWWALTSGSILDAIHNIFFSPYSTIFVFYPSIWCLLQLVLSHPQILANRKIHHLYYPACADYINYFGLCYQWILCKCFYRQCTVWRIVQSSSESIYDIVQNKCSTLYPCKHDVGYEHKADKKLDGLGKKKKCDGKRETRDWAQIFAFTV